MNQVERTILHRYRCLLHREKKGKTFNLTEMGNAERLVARNGQNLRYCVEFEEWLIWDGKTWVEDKKNAD
ncbi:hypothetical protein DI43_13185 [Geobacillus sp. CAMR12739]|nr:hypothetical protein DI43_13185 [Geobacillus sp. CAMR12739]